MTPTFHNVWKSLIKISHLNFSIFHHQLSYQNWPVWWHCLAARLSFFQNLMVGVLIAISCNFTKTINVYNFVIVDFINFYSLFLFGIVIDFWTSFVLFCLCVRVAGACFGARCPTSICSSSWIGSLWPTFLIGGSIYKIITSWYQRTYCLTSHVWGNSWYRLTIGNCTCGCVIVIVFIKKARSWNKRQFLDNQYKMSQKVWKRRANHKNP